MQTLTTASEHWLTHHKQIPDLLPGNPLHLPLIFYNALDTTKEIQDVLNNLNRFDNIVFGSPQNTTFFLEHLQKFPDATEELMAVCFARTEAIRLLLDRHDIPAIESYSGSKAIDLVESMLRFQRLGRTLYPCAEQSADDIPGFLEELDVECVELPCYRKEGPDEQTLKRYREQLENQPEAIFFHSVASVNQIPAAFPGLDLEEASCLAYSDAVLKKLEEAAITAELLST